MIIRSLISVTRHPRDQELRSLFLAVASFLAGFGRTSRAVALCIGGCLVASAAMQAAPVNFDIAAQPAPAALDLFIKQSGAQVVYLLADVRDIRTNEVKGAYELAAAMEILLKGTGLSYTERKAGQFSVGRITTTQTGSIKGSLVGEGGGAVADVLVTVSETAQSASTNRYGEYVFPKMAAGTYVLVANAPGYQPLHIVDVMVKAGRDVTLGKEELHKALGDVTTLEPVVVHADAVTELEKVEVTGSKGKPFEGANVDIPRTINDTQPYYIFDAKTIDESGAVNTEDFLKQRLTMNGTALTNGQTVQTTGNTSTLNLRALGTDKTLILINGRRVASVVKQGSDSQPDLNGLPLSAIDRIEVLPSSSSGIYGGSAIGGVVNIILKQDYVGGEVRATYDNTWHADTPTKSVSLSYGMALEGGKTHVMFNASWSQASSLLLQDRHGTYEQNLATALQNSPTFIYSSTSAILGAVPNIVPSSSSLTTLTLKNGTVINSRRTHISPGTSATTSTADLSSSLAANGGTFSLDLPLSTQAPSGLARPFGSAPKVRSVMASLSRQMRPWLELFADFSYSENSSHSVYSPFTSALTVPLLAPTNPFTTAVSVRVPDGSAFPLDTQSVTRNATVGAIIKLPREWMAEADYTWSQNQLDYFYYNATDTTAISADLLSGALNPFVDTLKYPLGFSKYAVPYTVANSSELRDWNLRGSGPLPSLPWGQPTLTVGLEHRLVHIPEGTQNVVYPVTKTNSSLTTYYARDAVTNSGYAEAVIPLVKQDWLPGVHALDLQASGRSERYEADIGTTSGQYFYNRTPATTSYDGYTLNNLPFMKKADYNATNYTVGLKYQPVRDVTLRVSQATAFTPPSPGQLLQNPLPVPGITVNDPVTGQTNVPVSVLFGGNPDLTPQNSKSLNAGVIWEPHWQPLKGLRLNAEYFKIQQDDAISSLGVQDIVNQESFFPGRVIRNGSGTITQVDASALNLFHTLTEGWDLSADYSIATSVGRFSLRAAESIILHLKNQISQTLPETESAGYSPSETGNLSTGSPKYKSNGTVTWQNHGWTLAWTARYYSSYKQFGAAGGPYSVLNYNGAAYPFYIQAQGTDTISSQTYHDFFASYAFGKRGTSGSSLRAKLLDGVTVQVGVRNIFDKVPPFDVKDDAYYYVSPYGDMRLRSYWISLRKEF